MLFIRHAETEDPGSTDCRGGWPVRRRDIPDIPHPCCSLLKMREYFSKRFRAVRINLPKINQLKEGVRNVGYTRTATGSAR
jgi:hypothetical protein